MRPKQKLATMLAVLLILLQGFPAFAVAAEGLQEPESTTIIQDSGTPSEPSENQNKPPDALPENGASSTEKPSTPSDADTEQKTEENLTEQEPENSGNLTEPIIPEDVTGIQTPSDVQPPEVPITEIKAQREMPVFTVELVEDGENLGLYGTLDYIPEDTTHITVLYSFSGVDFEPAANSDDGNHRTWDLSSLSKDDGQPKLTQLCVGVNDHPLKAYQSGEVNSLYIMLEIKRNSDITLTEPVKLSREETLPVPDMPPAFSANIESAFEGYVLKGTFTDFLPNTSCIRPLYSLDGETYEPIGGALEPMDWDISMLGTEDPEEQAFMQTQICAYATDEPLQSYLKQGLERFYIKLQITTVTGDTYDTQAAVIERGTPQPPPENTIVSANFTASMSVMDRGQRPPYTYGKYQLTVKENAAPEDVYALLPDTLPIEVCIEQPNTNKVITSGIAECEVTWKELPQLDLTAGEAFTIPDAANELVIPAGTEVSTPLGIYVLTEALVFDSPYVRDEIRIVLNAVGADEKPDISLTGNEKDDFTDDFVPLSLAFRLKPSGATSIKAYSYVEGEEDWTEICELLSSRDINANQSAELYGYVDILQPDESPYADYLKGEINGFLIGIIIEGGTFDGERVILPWPGEYNPPAQIPELDGSGGNDNNAGSGGGDSTEEGQRPDLPKEPEQKPDNKPDPPSIVHPPTEGNPQVPEQVPPPSLPEITAPEQPQTDSSDTEKPTNESSAGEKTTAADQPFISQQPQSEKGVPAVSIQKGQTAEGSPSDQALSPQAEHPSAQTNDTTIPAPSTDEKEIDAGQRSDNKSETENTQSSLPMAATAAIVLVGGGIAVGVGVGTASGAVSGSGFLGRLLNTLRKFFSRR